MTQIASGTLSGPEARGQLQITKSPDRTRVADGRPTVVAINIAPASRLPMKSVNEVEAETGRGLIGDRYHGARHRQVTIQSATQLAAASEILGTPIESDRTRRNITISAGEVPVSPGHRLTIGSVELEVVREATPCKLLDDWIAAGAVGSLAGKAGAHCRVIAGGVVRTGDPVDLLVGQFS